MPKKAKSLPTMARVLWSIVESSMQWQHVTKGELAARSGVCRDTVTADAKEPERIPLARIAIYFKALGIDPAEVLRPLAHACAEQMLEGMHA